jgi:hypothetical protein
MTDEQINAAIDKIKGFSDYECRCESCHPDWCNDLNAMHEAEKVLRDKELLFEYGMHISNSHHYEYLLRATARERAEAFLRTLGKWEDGK